MTELPQATSRRELRERAQAADARPPQSTSSVSVSVPVPRVRTTRRHGVAQKLLSLGAMVFAGALAVGMSVPANAFSINSSSVGASAESSASAAAASDIQTVKISDGQTVPTASADSFQVLSWAQVLAQKYAAISSYQFAGGSGSIRWPFPYTVPISSPYGPRIAPCGGCSTLHNGVDFTPGEGSAIFAIADGVVTAREDGTSEYGNFVVITHKIGGHSVTSPYAHMLAGSSAITLGQTVHVGDLLGLVGQTGEATGPHLHFEIAVDGARTDPIPWLEANVD